MCDHLLTYRHIQQFQQRRPAWHCSTCGRVAYRPLDCCAQPAFTSRAPLDLQSRRLWLGKVVELWRQIDVQGLQQWLGRSVGALRRRRTDDGHANEIPVTPVVGEDDYAEAAEVGNTPVGVGDRQ
jgi:hypothetical protein